jgi:hypothetical protein
MIITTKFLKIYTFIVLTISIISILAVWNFFQPIKQDKTLVSAAVGEAASDLDKLEFGIASAGRTLGLMNLSASSSLEDAKTRVSCEGGDWVEFNGSRISLGQESLTTWNIESSPSILTETLDSKNTVLLGHNNCFNGSCYTPTTEFGKVINLKVDQTASACISGNLYSGKILYSKAVKDDSTYILDNWFNQDIVTAFTCYGECYDANCTSVKERWVVVFEK